jgi:hypothetical protein
MMETAEIEKNRGERSPLQAESLEIRSGKLLLIDQFMLGNQQFLAGIEESGVPENHLKDYGAAVLSVDPGRWKVYRFPRERAFVLCKADTHEDVLPSLLEEALHSPSLRKGTGKPRMVIETRCAVFLDFQLVRDRDLVEKFSHLRKRGEDKEARDFLRESGGAVRYGFSQESDELQVTVIEPEGAIVLMSQPHAPASRTGGVEQRAEGDAGAEIPAT